ncbi:MAG TPA: VanZ family protein [Candidatus Acetothermia bacterium]|nr:VanZ family protein [Candidatus Acetothermia bacterium]
MNKRRIAWIVVLVIYASLVFAISSMTMSGGRPLLRFQGGDKILHFLEFGLFYLLSWKAFRRQRFMAAFLLTAFYAGSDEFHQIFVLTREASILDWLADIAGATCAAGGIALLLRTGLPAFLHRRILAGDKNNEEGSE